MLRLYRTAQAWALPAAAAAALLAGAPSASAATTPTIHFDEAIGGGGSVSYPGASEALSGNNIRLDTLFGVDTPSNDGVSLACEDCTLSFLTGANASEMPFWTFSPGGSFTVTGTVTDGDLEIASETLLSGSFNDTTLASKADDSRIVVSGSVDVTLNDALAAFYGTSTLGLAVMTQIISLTEPVDLTAPAFEGTSTATTINSFSVVPVPATLPLFLSALAGIAMIGRRTHSASA